MKLEFSTGIKCPKCGGEVNIESGFWNAMLFGSVVDTIIKRIKKEGATLTCPHCHEKSWIEPETA